VSEWYCRSGRKRADGDALAVYREQYCGMNNRMAAVFSGTRHALPMSTVLAVQLVVIGAMAVSWVRAPADQRRAIVAAVLQRPYRLDVSPGVDAAAAVRPLYDEPSLVSDEQLAGVLKKLVPRFSRSHLRPNLIEHALRTWGQAIEFRDPDAISGPFMVSFLTDAARHLSSWDGKVQPLLADTPEGVHIRFAEDSAASVHHDHALAALTEAGLRLDAPVFTTMRPLQLRHVLSEALRDFRLDEPETEWSSMCFALWLAPQEIREWHNGSGRRVTLDMLADRLMRQHKRVGVCLGLHRVYTLTLLLRLNESQGGRLLQPATVSAVEQFLLEVRDLMVASQWPDGSWNGQWSEGAECSQKTDPQEKLSKRVIATGHQLEWLAMAPERFHPPRETVERAVGWLLRNVEATPQSEIDQNYTFYSHVAKSLCLWRGTSPAEFWMSRVERQE
jgi:hypothetical protein